MSIFVLTQNKHTIRKFEAQLRNLAKHIEARSKKHNGYKKKNVYYIAFWKPIQQTLTHPVLTLSVFAGWLIQIIQYCNQWPTAIKAHIPLFPFAKVISDLSHNHRQLQIFIVANSKSTVDNYIFQSWCFVFSWSHTKISSSKTGENVSAITKTLQRRF